MDSTQEPDAAPDDNAPPTSVPAGRPTDETSSKEPPRKAPPSLLFRLVIPVTGIFVFTCFLVMTHDLTGDQNSGFAAFLREHGTALLGWEAAAAIVMAIIAMTVDRIRTLRETSGTSTPDATSEDTDDKPQSGS